MVASIRCCSKSDLHDSETQFYEDDHSFVSGKRLKMSNLEHNDLISYISVDNMADIASPVQPYTEGCSSNGCSDDAHFSASCCNPNEEARSHAAMEGSCQLKNNNGGISQPISTGETSCQEKRYDGCAQATSVSGWMYVNEHGQMCGPYIQEQLYEGLSTGFLPEELPVYPVVNGNIVSAVPLKYFKHFPDHAATGFAYLTTNISSASQTIKCSSDLVNHGLEDSVKYSAPVMAFSASQSAPCSCVDHPGYNSDTQISIFTSSDQHMSNEELCWVFEDDEGRKRGPHSLLELYSWYHYGYLHDSLLICHVENKFQPFTLISMINAWRPDGLGTVSISNAKSNDNSSLLSFITEISEEVCDQLHSGIMRVARRVVLDEIVSNFIPEFAAA